MHKGFTSAQVGLGWTLASVSMTATTTEIVITEGIGGIEITTVTTGMIDVDSGIMTATPADAIMRRTRRTAINRAELTW